MQFSQIQRQVHRPCSTLHAMQPSHGSQPAASSTPAHTRPTRFRSSPTARLQAAASPSPQPNQDQTEIMDVAQYSHYCASGIPASTPEPVYVPVTVPVTSVAPTALAVGDAVLQYRQSQAMTRDEVVGRTQQHASHGYTLTADRLRLIENGESTATVDDLVALAFALDLSPTVLLGHLAITAADPDQPLATAMPADLGYLEYQQWLSGEISLDPASRLTWYQNLRANISIQIAHHQDQLDAVVDELDDWAHAHEDTHDHARLAYLNKLNFETEQALNDLNRALRLAEHQIEILAGRA